MSRLVSLALVLVACSSSPPVLDAALLPMTLDGHFVVKSHFDLAAVPPAAADALARIADATDDPDDPGRYLVDRLISALPDGEAKSIAHDLAPVVAAYLQVRLAEVAPMFVPGMRAIADRLLYVSQHFTTLERWTIAPDGATARTITGVEAPVGGQPIDLEFQLADLGDVSASTRLVVDGSSNVTAAQHTIALDYGQLLRLGLDHAVIPSVDPMATDLARALRDLVDCNQLGAQVASCLGFGSASLYAVACDVGLTTAANELYAQLPPSTTPVSLSQTGAARGLDTDGDLAIDALSAGIWTGTADGATLAAATFDGDKQ